MTRTTGTALMLAIAGLFALVRVATTEPAPPDVRSDLARANVRLHEVDTGAFDVRWRIVAGSDEHSAGEPSAGEEEQGVILRRGAARYTRMFGVERLALPELMLEADLEDRTITLGPPGPDTAEAGPEMIGGMLTLCDTVRQLGTRDGRRGYLLRMGENLSPEYASAEIWIDVASGVPAMMRLTGRPSRGSRRAAQAIEMRLEPAAFDRAQLDRFCSLERYVSAADGVPQPAADFAGWEVVDLRGR